MRCLRNRRMHLNSVRVFNAPRHTVFAAFIEPDAILAWWAPKGWYTPHVEMDVRPGGRFRFGMRSETGPSLMFIHGEYQAVDPPERLVFSYVWEPGGAGERWHEFALVNVVTTVTLRFRDLGEGYTFAMKASRRSQEQSSIATGGRAIGNAWKST